MRRLMIGMVLACSMALLIGACGGGSGGDNGDSTVVVSAASSLEAALTAYADDAGIDAKQQFAGSDELAAQIRQGVKPDVYAAANTTLPDELHADGLVEKPVEFASNTLVLAVPGRLGDRLPRRSDQAGHHDRDRRGIGAGRLLHPRGPGPAAGG